MRASVWLARVWCMVLLVLVFGSPARANQSQRHVLDASINLGWVTETLAREGRTAANQADVALGMALAEAHVRAVVDLLRAPYQDLDFSGVLAALSRWDGATAGMSAAHAAAHIQQIQRHLREVVSVYFDARTQRLVWDGTCDSSFADVGFHFGRAHIAGLRGEADGMTGHLGNMRQAIRGGLQQDQLKLCGFGVPVDWDRVPVLRGDGSADGFWWSLVLIQAIALQAGRGGGTVGAVPAPLPSPVGLPPAPPPVATPLGSSAENAAPSCRHILEADAATGDGVYWLDPAGGDPFPAYCDMTRDDGGWTLYAIGADLPAGSERDEVTEPWGPMPQVLRQGRAEALVTVSTGLFRISDPAVERGFFIRDVRPLFDSGGIGGFGRGHVWATNADSVACATSYEQVRGAAMAATGAFDIDCESRGPGSHDCGTINGWILFHRGGTYDYDGQHPCSIGHGQSLGLVVRWVR